MKKKNNFDDLEQMFANHGKIKLEIAPMIDGDDEEALLTDTVDEELLPVLPVLDQVLLPGVIMPVAAQRMRSRRLLNDMKGSYGRHILVFSQRNDNEEPTADDLFQYGVVAKVVKVFDIKDEVTIAVLQGTLRCTDLKVEAYEPYMMGTMTLAPEGEITESPASFARKVKKLRKEYAELASQRYPDEEFVKMLVGIGSDKIFLNFAASHIDASIINKNYFLRAETYSQRVDDMLEQVRVLKAMTEMKRDLDNKTNDVISRQQREFFLRHQLDVIQEELSGNGGDDEYSGNPDLAALAHRASQLKLPKAVRELYDKEMHKANRTMPSSSDYSVYLTYLETLLDVPWTTSAEIDLMPITARLKMDEDHYGIEKVKDRIEEYIAIMDRMRITNRKSKAQVLCLVGPPGTGKTSICRSIATAMNRPYCRVALGGLHDEAEIRGHRRTYVGAMMGRIMQEIVKCKVNNPVFVLDEIDKVQQSNFHGDPSSALLEVLDPEQNSHFHDNYLGIDFDLSNVFFIATANSTADIPPALLDRMEVIEFNGYILEEKIEIANQHLLPRLLRDNGLTPRGIVLSDEMMEQLINEYTRESGVRQLEKQLAKLVRQKVLRLYYNERGHRSVTEADLRKVLGLPIHNSNRIQERPREGVVTGLAWTPVGGEILFIESSTSPGKGTLSLTGNLGDVMKESATLAFEYIKANSAAFGIDYKKIEESNIHIHVPEGATPKDGPSAGITMFTAMVSAFTGKPVMPTVAMTGEITLRGDVTPVGGIREKVLAAKRAGVTDIVLCADNRRDIEDIKSYYLDGLTFHYVSNVSQVLPLAFEPAKAPKPSRKKAK